ncbi:MAG: AAA family ATPase [Peptococcales bacterium]|jgi:exonuclease SbcC
MKPLHLKIAGLNSFREEQEVDFIALSETGVFGIFGPTGSGKSSVLDAVTLALYGKVERAKNGTQGIINQNEGKLYVQFAFQVGENKYTAERTYKRGNDGSINQSSCRLLQIEDSGNSSCLAEKKREMDEKVQEILGLTADDFTRAVVLPQGKFQEFLTLQGAERRKMLQRIFALERYGEQLVKKIRERVNKAQMEQELKKHELAVLGDASEETIKKAERDVQAKQLQLKKLTEKLDLLNKKWEEYNEVRKLTQELDEVNESMCKLDQEDKKIQAKIKKLDLAQKAEYLRPYLNQLNDEKEALANKELAIKSLVIELRTLETHYAQVEKEYRIWDNMYQNEGKALEGRLVKLEGALEDEKNRDAYNEKLLQLRDEYQKLNEITKTVEQALTGLKKQKENKEVEKIQLDGIIKEKEIIVAQGENIESQKEAWQELLEVTSRLEENINDLNRKENQLKIVQQKKNELIGQIEEYENKSEQIHLKLQAIPVPNLNMQQLYQEQSNLQSVSILLDTIQDNEKKLANKQKDLTENTNALIQQEKLLSQEKKLLDEFVSTRNHIIEKITLLEEKERDIEKENYALRLRETLEAGKPCPVCGSLEHGTIIETKVMDKDLLKEISLVLAAKKQEQVQIEEKITKQGKVLASTEAHLGVLKAKTNELQDELKDLQSKVEENRKKLPAKWETEKTDNIISLVKLEEEKIVASQKQLTELERAKEILNTQSQEYENKLVILRQNLSATEAELRLIQIEKENLIDKEQNLQEIVNTKKKRFKELSQGKSGPEVEKLFNLLKTSRLEMQRFQQEKDLVLEELERLSAEIDAYEKKLQDNLQNLKLLENDGRTYRKFYDDLTARINLITEGEKAQKVITLVESQLQVIVDNLSKYKGELEQARKSLEEKNRGFQIITQEITNLKNNMEKYREIFQEKMRKLEFVSLGQLEDALCTEEERRVLAEEISAYNETKLLVQEKQKDLIIKLANRSLTEEQWQQFLVEKHQVEEEERQEREESYRLKLNLDSLKEKNIRWDVVTKELKVLTNHLDQLARLDKLFKGNTFVEFIAEEQLIHVAIDASRRLGELTNYRYALEVDSDGGFIIRDDANGGLKRPVTTLSGGEIFLTSLSLALALSSQIQLRGKYPLEFFFLDEGFGTLDNYLLETVMNSLERLRLERMTIGIISHVPELRARMPRSLIVEPAEKGGRGTRLRLDIQ